MLGYGRDESAPTPGGMFATHFVEGFVCISLVFVDFSRSVRCIIAIRQQCFGKPFATKWQTVSSRRSRFIVPAYTCSHAFAICSEYIHVMFATCSLSVCYIFAMQKYGFCATKVWFLACKKGVFALQKYGFCKALISRWLHCFCVSGRCSNTINVRNRRYS